MSGDAAPRAQFAFSERTLDALSAADRRLGGSAGLRAFGDSLASEAAGRRRLERSRRFLARLVDQAPRVLAIALRDILASDATCLAKARLAAAALRAAPRDQTVALTTLFGLERLHPFRRAGPAEAEALADLIEAAIETGRGDLTQALGLTLRGVFEAPEGSGAARAMREARLDRLQTRIGLWRTGRLLSILRQTEAADRAAALYTVRYPYHRGERGPTRTCRRLLVLNCGPDLQAETLAGVHMHGNLAGAYPRLERVQPLALDVLLLDGLDFARVRDEIDPPDAILNNLPDAETMERHGAGALIREIADHFGAPLVNPPEALALTARDAAWRRIGDGPGVICPKTVRLDARLGIEAAEELIGKEFDCAVAFRPLSAPSGPPVRIARRPCEARAALEALGFGGTRAPEDVYAAAHVDGCGADGSALARLYRIDGRTTLCGGRETGRSARPADAAPRAVIDALGATLAETGLDACGVDFALAPDGRAVILGIDARLRAPGREREALDRVSAMLERRAEDGASERPER